MTRRRFIVALAAATIVGGKRMAPTDAITEFRNRIGLPVGALPPSPAGVVAADWSALTETLRNEHSEWVATAKAPLLAKPGIMSRDWMLQRGGDRVRVSVSVATAGFHAAIEEMIDNASQTMMMTIPFARKAGGPGDITLASVGTAGNNELLWVYRNVFVSVRSMSGQLDLKPIAGSIQQFARSHRTPSLNGAVPRITQIAPESRAVTVARTALLHLHVTAAPEILARLMVRADDGALAVVMERGDAQSVVLKALKPGTVKVDVMVGDPVSLLSDAAVVELEVKADSAGR
jgi:hypothetical protein